MCSPPGATYTRFSRNVLLAIASHTHSGLIASSRDANSRVNSLGICCTITTAAASCAGRRGMISASARGPPVDDAIATTLLAASGFGLLPEAIVEAEVVGAADTLRMLTARAASSADRN